MNLAEKERVRLERHRLYQKKYRQKQAVRTSKPHPVPVHMTWEMRERLDYLVMVHKPPGGTSEFMRRAFEFYAAHLLGTAPPADVVKPALEIPTQSEPAHALEIPTVAEPAQEAKIDPVLTKIDRDDDSFWIAPSPAKVDHDPTPYRYDPANPFNHLMPKIKVPGRKEKVAKTLLDAEKRVPVRIEFTRKHHHIPWGMRHMMWDNGLQHRGNVWRGRLLPERAARMAEEVIDCGGTLEITGGLGDAPKWAPGEYRNGSRKKKVETV